MDSTDHDLPNAPGITIDVLAQRTRMTVRNIRAYQSRGLVQPPALRGRTGFYGDEHVARIELIRELQSEGFNLEAIRRLIEEAGGETDEVLRFTRAVREPFEREEPREVGIDELTERWGDRADARILSRALELGLLRDLGNERYEERSPRLSQAGLELARLGVDPETGLDVIASARRHAEGVAESYVQLFLNEIWKPFVAEGRPEEKWPEVRDAIERLRPLATEVLLAVFGLAMTEATERAFGRELDLIREEAQRADQRADAA
jgi:DNA-binding transcriptional MerR regulator